MDTTLSTEKDGRTTSEIKSQISQLDSKIRTLNEQIGRLVNIGTSKEMSVEKERLRVKKALLEREERILKNELTKRK